ncbi:MAG: hypothetical protein RIQ84_180 [Pseudomonadota bacterium]|jgi:hypothetical protein
MKSNFLIKGIVITLFAQTLLGCASLTPEKVNQRISSMNEFELCLASEAGMDKQTFVLDPAIIVAAKGQIILNKFDCSAKREEIIQFLVKSLRDEERRNLDTQIRFGIGIRGGW